MSINSLCKRTSNLYGLQDELTSIFTKRGGRMRSEAASIFCLSGLLQAGLAIKAILCCSYTAVLLFHAVTNQADIQCSLA